MKTAIYIEDSIIQLVLTPQKEYEKNALLMFVDNKIEVEILKGSFYNCNGGWIRHGDLSSVREDDNSLILKLVDQKK